MYIDMSVNLFSFDAVQGHHNLE